MDFEVIFDRVSDCIKANLPALITACNTDKQAYAVDTGRPLVQLEEIEDSDYLDARWIEGTPTSVPPYAVSYVLDWLNPQISGNTAGTSWRIPFAFHILINETFEQNMKILMLRYAIIQEELITKYVSRVPAITGGVTILEIDAVPMVDNENGHPFTACSIMFSIDLPF
ncbi:MAG: hypothetical protein NTV01_01805 [Bacteroidia bacterium]|nr:hypothetical protein [Bacteroidia bacterium]